MFWNSKVLLWLAAAACLLSSTAGAITFDWVTVGNPGNAADTTGYGAVAASYQIGKYEVTISQYTAFLNAVAATDTYSLYDATMGSNLNIAGISRSGSSGSYSYSVIGSSGNKPITYVTWFDAARFVNWVTNGQGSGSTETGAYTLNGVTSGSAVAVNAGAAFYLPTTDQWYKAAFFSPNYGGVGVPGYYDYATQSDTIPGNVVGSGANQANWLSTVYSVTQSGTKDPNQNYLTDVGAFSGSGSFYGTFDQSGNVFEWTDSNGLAGPNRDRIGGAWDRTSSLMSTAAVSTAGVAAASLNERIGFRIAAVPEPSTWVMAAVGLAGAGWGAWRRRRAR
jgi:formylglycine-generating enzyme